MHSKDTILAIRNLYKDSGLNVKDKIQDIEHIEEEIDRLKPLSTIASFFSEDSISIEQEMATAKMNGLKQLQERKEAEIALDYSLPLSLIRMLAYDSDIEYPVMIHAIVTTYLNLQNGMSEVEALKLFRSTMSRIFEELHGDSKRRAAEQAVTMTSYYFDSNALFNNRKKGKDKHVITDFGFMINLP